MIGLVELYLKHGKPIGSQTLQDNGFESLSSATIRNYFSKMETMGLLKQQHTSGGRIPTAQAFRIYADAQEKQGVIEKDQEELLDEVLKSESREVATLLHKAAEALSEASQCAVFASAPRFDQDFIQDVRLVHLDSSKLLTILITDFGLIRTETIYLDRPVDPQVLRAAEEYFLWRMNKGEKPLFKHEADAKWAQRIYNEVIVRHVVGYVNFPVEDILRTGLSKLLAYPEFNDAAALANSLGLIEDQNHMRTLLRNCCQQGEMLSWIGDELCPYVPPGSECTVIAIPYRINQAIAGAIAVLGPMRVPYKNLFGLAQFFSEQISKVLTRSVYKYKITYRQATGAQGIENDEPSILLENKKPKSEPT
ncbi:MAG: heat-inducible transcriptional repressor HrcA [Verrucomicrobia bacterium]|nr:heat-inducible transcriptional repressor HrcA [Verrucomicrobiota bacterium]